MSIDRSWWRLGALAAMVLAAIAMLAAAFFVNPPAGPPVAPALRLSLPPVADLSVGAGPDYPFGLALAPDGRRLVFPAVQAGRVQLWMRDLTTGTGQPLPGTDDGVLPFWSPDGRSVGFFAGGRLRAFTFENGSVHDLADAPSPRGGAWHPNGDVVFAPRADGGLSRRRGSNGSVEPFTTFDAASGETGHLHPAFLDAGRHVIFFVRSGEPTRQGIWIAPVDDPSNRRRLAASDAHGLVGGSHVLYASDSALVAQRIDLETRTLAGPPILLGTPVGRGPLNQLFAASGGDMVVYGAPSSRLRELRWVDRAGTWSGGIGEAMEAWDVRIAPGRASVAVTRLDPQINTLDIWVYDGDRPLPRRISPGIDVDETAAWDRDGATLAWVSGRRSVTLRGSQAMLPEEALWKFERPVRVTDWSRDGRSIVVSESRAESRNDILILPPDGSAPRAYAQSPFNEVQGVLSPDGRWMAYASDESGRFEIYLDAFPNPGRRARLTSGGGVEPRWRDNGGELYFRRGSEIHAVTLQLSGDVPAAAASERLFDANAEIRSYDVTSDGQRFLLNVPATDDAPQATSVIVNVGSLLGAGR